MSLIFLDETGNNPLPPGIQVSIYPAGSAGIASALIGQAFTLVGGTCAIELQTALPYTAVFGLSFEAPSVPVTFVYAGNPTTVPVTGYTSPDLSMQGYVNVQLGLYPAKWYTGQAPGTMPYGFAVIFAAALGAVDLEAQTTQGALRLQSSFGNQIDTWAADFFGQWLPRYAEELDPSYYTRILAMLQAPKTTLQCLQNVATAFYTAIALETGEAQNQNLTFDGQGGFDTWGGYDISQGFAASIPAVYVWDRQSRPDLADMYDVNPNNNDGSFVIQIGTSPANEDAWYLDYTHVDYEAFLLDFGSFSISGAAPDPRLAALINFVKAGGTKPLYATAIVSA